MSSQLEINSMVHQLPSDCYPPSDSDDESFVVLERSLGPDYSCKSETPTVELFSPDVIDQSLEIASDALQGARKVSTSLSPMPAMPKFERSSYAESLHSVSSDLTHDEIQRKVVSLIEENTKLKETLHQNNMVMKNQYETLIGWQKDVEKVHESHKKKFTETKVYIQELQKENAKLVSQLQQVQKGFSLPPSYVEVTKQDDAVKESEKSMHSLKLDYEDRIDKLNELEAKNNVIVKTLRDEMVQKEQEFDEKQQEFDEKEQEFDEKEQRYLEQITGLKVVVEKLRENQADAEETNLLKSQLSAAQSCIIELREDKKIAEGQLRDQQDVIRKLESGIKELHTTADRSVALEQQLTIYKSDFETERKSKTIILAEKNQLIEDFQCIQRRNEELLQEVESLRAKCTFVEVSNGGARSSGASPSASAPPQNATPSPPPTSFSCPLCNRKFRLLRQVEEHVEECINNSP